VSDELKVHELRELTPTAQVVQSEHVAVVEVRHGRLHLLCLYRDRRGQAQREHESN
jgi:hypothetical protein